MSKRKGILLLPSTSLSHRFLSLLTVSDGGFPLRFMLFFCPSHTLHICVPLNLHVHIHVHFFNPPLSLHSYPCFYIYISFSPPPLPPPFPPLCLHFSPYLRIKSRDSLLIIVCPCFPRRYINLRLRLPHHIFHPLYIHLCPLPLPIPHPPFPQYISLPQAYFPQRLPLPCTSSS